ncbi:MAG: hypothetical protein QOH49_3364 [Acidobacteriota bacterium]|jgi:hypothetical protein|nr:hypothetical protein [Acidobacteriota bacterium]
MRSDKFDEPAGHGQHRGGRFELFFYEQVGTRYYLRFTRLALLLIVCLTVIPMVAICALFFTESHADLENVNINIRSQSQAPGNDVRLIIQAPPLAPMPTPPKAGRSQKGGEPTRQMPAAPGVNANALPTPSPTPSPTPPKPPT